MAFVSIFSPAREGVRDSDAIQTLREYLHRRFNVCRRTYDAGRHDELIGIEIESLLSETPPQFVVEPLLDAIGEEIASAERSLFYIRTPQVDPDEQADWMEDAGERLGEKTFSEFVLADVDPWGPLCEYDAETGELRLNQKHPYAAKIVAHSKNQTPATLVAIAEVVTDALLRGTGLRSHEVNELLDRRDRVLRYLAGAQDRDALQVIRQLQVANTDETAMERAVGRAFEILGFEYEPRGRNQGGPDGVLRARVGKVMGANRDFVVVYDAKTTDKASIPVDKVDLQALKDFANAEGAEFSLVVGKQFAAQGEPEGSLNKRVKQAYQGGNSVTILLTEDLVELVKLHYRFGLTFDDLSGIFKDAHTVPETRVWVTELRTRLETATEVLPLRALLDGLEAEKTDTLAIPNLNAARTKSDSLKSHSPEKLLAALEAVSTLLGARWLEVNPAGNVRMGQSASEICVEFGRRLEEDLGVHELSMVQET